MKACEVHRILREPQSMGAGALHGKVFPVSSYTLVGNEVGNQTCESLEQTEDDFALLFLKCGNERAPE